MKWIRLLWHRVATFLRGLFQPSIRIPGGIQTWPRVPAKSEPDNCPNCAGLIERVGEEYVCRGVEGEASARVHLRREWDGRVPLGLSRVEPCGWRAPASDFGRTWV